MDQQINQWLERVLTTSSWIEYDDLHITEVDGSYSEKRQKWIELGLKILKKSNALLKKSNDDSEFFCALGFSLKSTKNRKGHDFFDASQLLSKLDATPPSVYLFKRKWSQWMETVQQSSEINLRDIESDYKCYLVEREGVNDNGFYRSIFVVERGQ
jgi:hypothetical protein